MLTKKDLYNLGDVVYYVHYCDLQHSLSAFENIGTNYGVYGWNWTAYLFTTGAGKRVIINTGYRNLTGKRVPKDLRIKAENQAIENRKNAKNWDDFYKKSVENINKLIEQMEIRKNVKIRN